MTQAIGGQPYLRQVSKIEVQLILESLEKTAILQLDLNHRVIYDKKSKTCVLN
jgi:hypothetical protein